MKAKDLRQLTDDELAARVRDLRDSVFNQRIRHATGQLRDAAGRRTARRELARALTVQRERVGG